MMDDNALRDASALTALNHMMRGGHFNICTIDSVAKLLNRHPDAIAYSILRPLHCVNWNEMPTELRNEIPQLIQRCLGVEPSFQFVQQVAENVTPMPKRGPLLFWKRP